MNTERRRFMRQAVQGRRPPSDADDTFEAQLQSLRRVDSRLIGYDEVDRVVLDVARPRGIAHGAGGRLWVVAEGALLLFVDGRERGRAALSGAGTCVAECLDEPLVYVGLEDRIELRTVEAARLGEWPRRGEGALVTSLAAARGVVFVADAGLRAVERRGRDGRLLGRIADGAEPLHFVVPSPFLDLALTREGVLWTTNPGRHRVESYTLAGEPRVAFGGSGAGIDHFCGCCNPTHVAVLGDGRVVTSEKGLPRVKVLDASGQLDTVVADGTRLASSATALDLAVDDRGRVLVLDPQARAVRVFAPRVREGRNG